MGSWDECIHASATVAPQMSTLPATVKKMLSLVLLLSNNVESCSCCLCPTVSSLEFARKAVPVVIAPLDIVSGELQLILSVWDPSLRDAWVFRSFQVAVSLPVSNGTGTLLVR
jgi:hypothetical protein